jgi:hypothetical protein
MTLVMLRNLIQIMWTYIVLPRSVLHTVPVRVPGTRTSTGETSTGTTEVPGYRNTVVQKYSGVLNCRYYISVWSAVNQNKRMAYDIVYYSAVMDLPDLNTCTCTVTSVQVQVPVMLVNWGTGYRTGTHARACTIPVRTVVLVLYRYVR